MHDPIDNRYIASDDLTPADVPARATNWNNVVRFSATFDLKTEFPDGCSITGVADITASSTIPEMRMALYAEWRRYNHLGYDPDRSTIQQVQSVLDFLRAAIA